MTGSERWAALEIRLLTAFGAVVDHGSFAAAARQLGYTQSGISQQIAALERIVGKRLLIRHAGGRRPVQPTKAGELLLEHTRRLLNQFDAAYDDLVGQDEEQAKRVRLGVFSSVAVHILPTLLRELYARTDLRVQVIEEHAGQEPFAGLDSGEVEIAFAVLPVPERFHFDEIGSDPYVLVVPTSSRLAERSHVPIGALKGMPLLGIRSCASENEEAIDAELTGAGIDGAEFQRYEDNQFVQSLVGAGHGVAIVPSLTVDRSDERVRVVELHVGIAPRRIVLIHKRGRLLSAAARDFRAVAVEISCELLRLNSLVSKRDFQQMRRAG